MGNKQESTRDKAMQWWNCLASLQKTQICDTNTDLIGYIRRWETLTKHEIQMLYDKCFMTQEQPKGIKERYVVYPSIPDGDIYTQSILITKGFDAIGQKVEFQRGEHETIWNIITFGRYRSNLIYNPEYRIKLVPIQVGNNVTDFGWSYETSFEKSPAYVKFKDCLKGLIKSVINKKLEETIK